MTGEDKSAKMMRLKVASLPIFFCHLMGKLMIGHEILRAKIPEFQRQTHVFGLNYHCPDAPNRLQVDLGVLSMG